MKIKEKLEYYETTNRNLFNKHYKKKYSGCSICGWNSGCNNKNSHYGGHSILKKVTRIKYPSWKLVSKKTKQWMEKPKSYKIIEKEEKYTRWYTIKF